MHLLAVSKCTIFASVLLIAALLPASNAYSVNTLSTRQPISLTSSQAKLVPASNSRLFSDSSDEISTPTDEEPEVKKNAFAKMMGALKPKSSDDNTSTKEMLAKMGLSTLLSYGWVSNMYNCVNVSLAWFTFAKRTGLSPLVAGQWKPFLAVYAGFYVISNFMRPFRIALSVGVSKYFDSFISAVQEKTKVSRAVAIGITVFLFNIVGTSSFMALGVFTASVLAGVPVFPPKV